MSDPSYARLLRFLLLLPVLALLAGPGAAGGRTITVRGSQTMHGLNQRLAAEYALLRPDVRIDLVSEGSERGIQALLGGDTDIAAASRAMTEEELERVRERVGARPREVAIAVDGFGVYVHQSNPVRSLTVPQLAGIMSGDIRNWQEVGGLDQPIGVFTRTADSGTRTFLETIVLKGRSIVAEAHEVESTTALMSSVARNRGSIGYGGIVYAQGVDILRISAKPGQASVWPSRENVSNGEYPLTRPLRYYVNPVSLTPELEDYLEWVLGPAGQSVVTAGGYYALPPRLATAVEASAGGAWGPVTLSPENMGLHGFDASVTLSQSVRPDEVTVLVRFAPGSSAIADARGITVHIAGHADVPVVLSRYRSVEFTLRRSLLGVTSLHVDRAASGTRGRLYVLPLDVFATVR